jgi:hypothetical protein
MLDTTATQEMTDIENKPGTLNGNTNRVEAASEHTFSEGGPRGWLAVVGLWAVMFTSFGYTNCFG